LNRLTEQSVCTCPTITFLKKPITLSQMGLCCCRVAPGSPLATDPLIPVQELPQGNLDFIDNPETPDSELLPHQGRRNEATPEPDGSADEATIQKMLAEVDELSD
jgi:hypothetical protein